MATKNLGNISVKGYRFFNGGWSSTTYSSLAASYSGPNASGVWHATVDKITLPSFTNSKYQQPYSISLTVPILKGGSSSPASGSLYAYLYSSDPGGSSKFSTTPAADSPPSGHIGYGSVGYSGLTQKNQDFTVTINVNSTDLTSGGSYYVWLKTSTYTQIHYGGEAPTGSLTGTEVPSTYTISYNKNCEESQAIVSLPSAATVTSGSTYSVPSDVPWKYDAAMYWYETSGGSTVYPGGSLSNVTSNQTLSCCWETKTSLAENGSVTPNFYFPNQRRVYKFTPSVTRKYKINAPANTTGATNPDIYLYQDSNTSLSESVNAAKTNESITYTLNARTDYYIHIKVDTTGFSKGCTTNLNLHAIYNIKYDANGGSGTPSAQEQEYGSYITITTDEPTRTGYSFLGWSADENATTASYVAGDDYQPNADTTLYAVWKSNDLVLEPNKDYTATISTAGTSVYYSFTPSTTATYGIYSVHGSGDTYVYLYDSSNKVIAKDDDAGPGSNFRLTYNLTAGETYRFRIKFYSSSTTGNIPFYFGEVYTVSIAGINNITEVTGSGAYIYQEVCTINATPQEGYIFDRFELNGEEIKDNPYTFIPDEDITVNAYANRASYEISAVSSNTNRGTVSGGGSYAFGSQATLTATAKTGYQFNYWSDGSSTYDDNPLKWTVTSEDKTFTAYFKEEEVQKYTITYHSNNSFNKTIEIEYNYNTTPKTITLSQLSGAFKSHTFYYDKNASDAILAAQNVTLYPILEKWTTNADGTGQSYAPKTDITVLDDIDLYAQWTYRTQDDLSTPTRSGYNFIGWFTAPTGGTKITIIDDNVESGITIYAHWSQEITYAVDCLISEGIESIRQEGELADGQRYKITAIPKEGYEFYYFIQDSSDVKIWQNPYEFTIDKPYTYFQAFAKKIQYEIKYNPTRGTGIMTPGHKTYGEPYKVATNEFSAPIDDSISYSLILDYRDGTGEKTVENIQNTIQYNFSHWNLNSTSGNVYYENSTYDINEKAEFFANWSSNTIKGTYTLPTPTRETNTIRTYTINFNANGGTTEKTQGECKLQNEYTFTNWSNGTNTFSGGSEFSFDGSESSITLSANWASKQNRIPVTFPTKEECKRSGYELLGWGTTANTTTPYAQPGDEKFISGSPTFYAIWKQITYSVTYDLNGGDKSDAFQDQTNLTSYTIPNTIPTKTNSSFDYWLIKETGEHYSPGNTITLTQNITLQAVWLGYYTITILSSEGVDSVEFVSGTSTAVAGSTVQIKAIIKDKGYYFYRWMDNNGNQLSSQNPITIKNINQNYIITPIALPNYGINLLLNKGQANIGVNGSTGSFYSISLYYNRFWYQMAAGGQGAAPDTSQKITQLTPPLRYGYKFTGYYLNDGTQVVDENGVLTDDYTCITGMTYANARWKPLGLVHIRVDNEWKYAIPYIYDGTEWRQAIAHVYEKKTPDSSEYEWKVSI